MLTLKKISVISCCGLLLAGCGSDTEFKRQVNDNVETYLNTPELKPLIVPEGITIPKKNAEYDVPKALLEGAVGLELDIRPPIVPKSVIGTRARYNENGLVLTSVNPSDWTQIKNAMTALGFPILIATDDKIETGEILFDSLEKEENSTLGRFEVYKLNNNEIAFKTVALNRNQKTLTQEGDIQRYTLMFYNLIMSEIEAPAARFISNQSK